MSEAKVEAFVTTILADVNFQTYNSGPFAILKVYISDPELKEQYRVAIDNHNAKIIGNSFPDSGFDLFIPTDCCVESMITTEYIDLGILGQMIYVNTMSDIFSTDKTKIRYSPFLINPRSSISKTSLMLANNVGVIDSAYRGNLIIALRCLNTNGEYHIDKYSRFVQVCHPSYCPILVLLVDSGDIDMNTQRGVGGFGSTGISG